MALRPFFLFIDWDEINISKTTKHWNELFRHCEKQPTHRGEIVGGGKKWFTGSDVNIDARPERLPELILERWLGSVVLGHLILNFAQGLNLGRLFKGNCVS